MRNTLENLYYGNITPGEQQMVPNSELKRAVDRVARFEGQLTEWLDEDGQAILAKLIESQDEVKEKLKAAMEKNVHLDVVRSGKYTVAEWVRLWFDTYSKPAIREQTSYYYNNYIEKHIVPGIGDIKLDS